MIYNSYFTTYIPNHLTQINTVITCIIKEQQRLTENIKNKIPTSPFVPQINSTSLTDHLSQMNEQTALFCFIVSSKAKFNSSNDTWYGIDFQKDQKEGIDGQI